MFFRNFALSERELTPSRQKKEEILLFCSRLFVTLRSPSANLLRLGKKKKKFFCFALDFSQLCALRARSYSVSAKKKKKFFCFALDFS